MASDSPSAGHFYWQYHHLWEVQDTPGNELGRTFSCEGARSKHLRPIFRESARHLSFKVGLQMLWGFRPSVLRKELNGLEASDQIWVISYDGGFSEFLIFSWLSRKLPKLNFLFNFHWPLQWLGALSTPSPRGRALAELTKKAIAYAPVNMLHTSETHHFSAALRPFLGTSLKVFPVITSFPSHAARPWDQRMNDLLLLPQRQPEYAFAKEVASVLGGMGYRVVILANADFRPPNESTSLPQGRSGSTYQTVWGTLNQTDYTALLLDSRVALLPYDKNYGPWMSSGKFNDAVFFGCFPLVPSSTGMASQSSISELEHWYEKGPATSAAQAVERRLRLGFPSDLRAKTYADLTGFLSQHAEDPPTEKPSHRIPLLRLFLLFAAYRNPARLARVSQTLKSAAFRATRFLRKPAK